jgi:hypothetical protein
MGVGVFVAMGSVAMEGSRRRVAKPGAAADICVPWASMGEIERCSPGNDGNDVDKRTSSC